MPTSTRSNTNLSTRSNTTLPADFSLSNSPPTGRRLPRTMAAAPVVAPIPAPAPAEIWTENPNQGNFNPGTKAGSDMFKLKSKGLPEDKRLKLSRADAQKFKRLLEAKETSFGDVITKIETEFNPDGTISKYSNLSKDYSHVSVERLQRVALKRFGTAVAEADPMPAIPFAKRVLDPSTSDPDKQTFYERVNSHVVSEWLKNVLDEKSYHTLLLKKDQFSFVDAVTGASSFDGPIMLKLALDKMDPSTIVGAEVLRTKLENCCLHSYKNNVEEMCTDIDAAAQRSQRPLRVHLPLHSQCTQLGSECEVQRIHRQDQ